MDGGDAYWALNSLRVAELKQLCKEHGLPCTGRKGDIIERLVAHRNSIRPPGAKDLDGPLDGAAPSEGPSPKASGSGRGRGRSTRTGASSPAQRSTPSRRGRSNFGAGDHAAGCSAVGPVRQLQCVRCSSIFELQCSRPTPQFWCPPCRFKTMDPFNEVVEPNGVLKYAPVTNAVLDFALDLTELRSWRRENISVEIRMVRVESEKLCHEWPHAVTMLANGSEVFQVKPPEEGHKRRDVPQNISAGLKPGINSITMRFEGSQITAFAVGFLLTKPCEIPMLRTQVRRADMTEAVHRVRSVIARTQSRTKADEDIQCLSSVSLRLRCPITMDRIEEPVRGLGCQHLQCFSLEAYLMSNRQMRAFNNRWVCPVCTLVLRPLDLRIDSYVENVLKRTAEDAEEVLVDADGSWRVEGSAPVHQEAMRPTGAAQPAHTLELDSPTLPSQKVAPFGGPKKGYSSGHSSSFGEEPTKARSTAVVTLPSPKRRRHDSPGVDEAQPTVPPRTPSMLEANAAPVRVAGNCIDIDPSSDEE